MIRNNEQSLTDCDPTLAIEELTDQEMTAVAGGLTSLSGSTISPLDPRETGFLTSQFFISTVKG